MLANGNDIAGLLDRRPIDNGAHAIFGRAAAEAAPVAGVHMADDMHVVARAGRDVDVAGSGGHTEHDLTADVQRLVKGAISGARGNRSERN
jgi:hypothetical protein